MRWIRYIMLLGLLCVIVMMGGLLSVGYNKYQEVIDEVAIAIHVESIREQPGFVTLEEVDKDFLNAIVAVEDRRFYDHGPID